MSSLVVDSSVGVSPDLNAALFKFNVNAQIDIPFTNRKLVGDVAVYLLGVGTSVSGVAGVSGDIRIK